MMTDPISDLLTQVRNAIKAKHPKVDVPTSNTKVGIVELWKQEGFIRNYKLFRDGEKGVLRIYLKYVGKKSAIEGLKRISRPSRRVYCSYEKMPKVLGGLGVAILSTSRGILTDKVAKENKVGGELLCSVW
jgi:small subunit ribosomal protein S8